MDKAVLHVFKTSSYAGAENVAIALIKGLGEHYPSRYTLIYVSPEGSIRQRLEEEKIEFEPLKVFNIREIKRVINNRKPCIIHAHGFWASILCAITVGRRIKIISHLHDNPFWLKTICLRTITYLCMVPFFYRIIAVSDAVLEELWFNINKNKRIILPNPINADDILKRANMPISENYIGDIMFIGRLTDQKDPFRFISIIKKIKNKNLHVTAIMVGDGDLKQKCQEYIKETGQDDNIKLTGFLDNPFPILKNAKILCMPSKWEGFGMVAREALVLDVPVVASPVGGLKALQNYKGVRLCNTDEDFTDSIIKILQSEDTVSEQDCFTTESVTDNMRLYATAVNSIYESAL